MKVREFTLLNIIGVGLGRLLARLFIYIAEVEPPINIDLFFIILFVFTEIVGIHSIIKRLDDKIGKGSVGKV